MESLKKERRFSKFFNYFLSEKIFYTNIKPIRSLKKKYEKIL